MQQTYSSTVSPGRTVALFEQHGMKLREVIGNQTDVPTMRTLVNQTVPDLTSEEVEAICEFWPIYKAGFLSGK